MIKIVISTVVLATFLNGCMTTDWKTELKQQLPIYGHRNWIVVADSAYPKQSSSAIETIYTDKGQLEVLAYVLEQIESAPHVQANVLIDAELDSVTEKDAPGVDAYRKRLNLLLKDRQFKVMPHEEIISKLDKSAKLFNILLLKTDLTIPYTSVFFELECGYWDAEKERRLRNSLER